MRDVKLLDGCGRDRIDTLYFFVLYYQDMGEKKTALRSYLVFPKIQLKYACIFSGLLLLSMLVFIASEFLFLTQAVDMGVAPEIMNSLRDSLLRIHLSVMAVSVAVTFLISLLVTHRFLGPVVSIKSALDAYQRDKVYKKIVIRKTDEIQPLVDHLNKFIEALNDK